MRFKKYSIKQANKNHGSSFWYGRINDGGKITVFSLKTKKKSEALAWLDLMNQRRFLPEEDNRDKPLLEAINNFLESTAASKGKHSATFTAYAARLEKLKDFAKSKKIFYLTEFTPEMGEEYLKTLADFAPKTVRENLRCVGQFFKWSLTTYRISMDDPIKNLSRPKMVKRKKDFWTPEEIDKILDAAPDKEFRLFWALMAFAGLRHAEATSITTATLKRKKLEIIGKGNKQAFLPISDRLRNEIERFGDGAIDFSNAKFLHTSNANRILKRAVLNALSSVEGEATNHRFRHSFASNLIRSGANIKAVQKLMRHEDIQVTLNTYSHLLEEDLSAVLDK